MRFYCAIISVVFLFLFTTNVDAQSWKNGKRKYVPKRYMHSLGGTYVYNLLGDGNVQTLSLTYSPRYRITNISPNTSVTLGTNLSAGYNLAYKGIEEDTQLPFYYEFPVYIMLNIGQGALYRTRQGIGSYFALGGALNSINNVITNEKTLITKTTDSTYGIYGAMGIRFLVNQYYSYSLGAYTIMGKNGAVILGARLLFNFGIYETY